jgi:hypothetical protein
MVKKVKKGSTPGIRGNIKAYWLGVMRDPKVKPTRRDRAAKELFKIVSIMERMKNSRRKIAAMHTRAALKANRNLSPGGKKAGRKEAAAETASKGKWAGLIPTAEVLPFRGRK